MADEPEAPMSLHLAAERGAIAERVLLPGDPLRARWIAETWLTDVVCYNTVRGMLGFTGFWKGARVSVQGTGIGMPSMALYATELFRDFGVSEAIRVGTCGALQPDMALGDLVVAMAASTDSGMHRRTTGGLDLAPTASWDLLRAAVEAADTLPGDWTSHVGGVASMDAFYDGTDAIAALRAHGVLAVEMEASALYAVAARHRARALAILTVSDHVTTGQALTPEARERTLAPMIDLALATLLARTDRV
jgi:purine-nucleoside phosphorylase